MRDSPARASPGLSEIARLRAGEVLIQEEHFQHFLFDPRYLGTRRSACVEHDYRTGRGDIPIACDGRSIFPEDNVLRAV